MNSTASLPAKRPDEPEADRSQLGQPWIPCAMARESRLLLEVMVGPRTQASATELVEGAARRLDPDGWPVGSSDGGEPSRFALTRVFAVLIHCLKGNGPGRPKEPPVVPDPRVRSGQAIKQHVKGRLVAVSRRVLFGVEELIPPGANLDLALGAPERDDPPARCAAASQDA